eukprot:431814-Amorphochlora_amoeboformis.AAC.2
MSSYGDGFVSLWISFERDSKTFWITTGLFPQEFIITFSKSAELTRIRTQTKSVRQMSVEFCDEKNAIGKYQRLFGPVGKD